MIYYKNAPVIGWHGTFKIETDKEKFNKIIDAGLGARNSQGFGMVEVMGETL